MNLLMYARYPAFYALGQGGLCGNQVTLHVQKRMGAFGDGHWHVTIKALMLPACETQDWGVQGLQKLNLRIATVEHNFEASSL